LPTYPNTSVIFHQPHALKGLSSDLSV